MSVCVLVWQKNWWDCNQFIAEQKQENFLLVTFVLQSFIVKS